MKPRSLALLGAGMGLGAGGATAVAIGAPGSVSAVTPAAVVAAGDGSTTITDALQPLIDDGTITQAQADAVAAALRAAGPFGGGHGGSGGRMDGGRGAMRLDTAAAALGVSADDLRSALADGDSIADVAAEQGIDVQTVIDALVAEASARIDQQVTDGKLTADEAATKQAELTERITDAVNQAGGFGKGAGRPDRPGG